MVDLELLTTDIQMKLHLLGHTREEVVQFFQQNPEVLLGEDYEDPIARYLRNVLGIEVIVGTTNIRCGRGVSIPLMPALRSFINWYDQRIHEPDLGSGREGWVEVDVAAVA